MNITCPLCMARFPVQAGVGDVDAREALVRALALPAPLARLILGYLQLFAPAKQSLSWSRVTRILDDLLVMIEAQEITRNGRKWRAPIEHWKTALGDMLDNRSKLRLPLKGNEHGYLLSILVSLADTVERGQESSVEQQRQNAVRPSRAPDLGQSIEDEPIASPQTVQRHISAWRKKLLPTTTQTVADNNQGRDE